ncbi:MAG: HupE/UreJ family protein [Aphanocapsa lilacina HA4352-LM1]|nr:HupE/UreJ family protein [Aphanocapsa lilacina HA4352-LM1]
MSKVPLWGWLCLWACVAVAQPAFAHKPSDSYLNLKLADERVEGQWDIALRDLDYAIGLDGDDDGAITWGEVRSRQAQIADYALARLKLAADGNSCPPNLHALLIDRHSDGAYAVLRFAADCGRPPVALSVDYNLFFDLDPQHRGLLQLQAEDGGPVRTAILGPDSRSQRLEVRSAPWVQFFDFVREGVWHIWIGFDHILFLLTLLLPALFVRKDGRWKTLGEFREVFLNVVKVVTAFTVAHSITLGLAALGVVELPSRWVESAIAASVILAALNNLFPIVENRRWAIAFGFGLIHGFGFASVMADLGLAKENLVLSLLGFNLGVEVGQLAIVAVFLPIAFWLRDSWFYRRVVFTGGSVAVAGIAAVWLAERLFDWQLLAS